MRLVRLSALFTLLGLAPAQTLSGLTFDGQDVVSLKWAFDGQTSGRYDFYLCAGDESTGSYVRASFPISKDTTKPIQANRWELYRNHWNESSTMVLLYLVTYSHFELTGA